MKNKYSTMEIFEKIVNKTDRMGLEPMREVNHSGSLNRTQSYNSRPPP